MVDDSVDRIKYSVHQVIKLNASEKYPSLTRENEALIVKKICSDDNVKQMYLDLWAKRDSYDRKVHQFLEKLAPKVDVSSTGTTTYEGPDPRYITNRYHAIQYLKLRILTNEYKLTAIKKLIDNQLKTQQSWKQQRLDIIDKYTCTLKKLQDSVNTKQNSCGAMKLQSFKANILENRVKELNENHISELNKFDESILLKSKQISEDSKNLLAELNVPFFNLQPQFHYPDLKNDQEFLLEKLQKFVEENSTT